MDTAVHRAIKLRMLDNLEVLMKAGPDLKLPNVSGDTPLHLAASCTDVRVWELLLRHGGDIYLQNWQGESPVQKVIEAKNNVALGLIRAYHPNSIIGI